MLEKRTRKLLAHQKLGQEGHARLGFEGSRSLNSELLFPEIFYFEHRTHANESVILKSHSLTFPVLHVQSQEIVNLYLAV